MWGIGVYGQDEWKATRNLKLTLGIAGRAQLKPCLPDQLLLELDWALSTLPRPVRLVTVGAELDVPYSSDLNYNQHQAYPGVDSLVWSPRLGFSWDPRGNGKTVISGGFGQFYDNPAAGLVDNLLATLRPRLP